MTKIAAIAATALALAFGACNNFYHDLLPPDGDRIVGFEVEGQLSASIGENSVSVKVVPGTDLRNLVPRIAVSKGASLFPITFEYIHAAFPEADMAGVVFAMLTSGDLDELVRDLIRGNPGFSVPSLDKPIDFSGPVGFFVVAGMGNIRKYSVNVAEDSSAPLIHGFRFGKNDNPELMADSVAAYSNFVLEATAIYPAEVPGLGFKLIPSFAIAGDSLEADGVELIPGVSIMEFRPAFNVEQQKTLTLKRGESRVEYVLAVTFIEDPDTVRSITDFRFTVEDNPSIAATAVAAIVNDGDFGTISVQVLHEGPRPAVLVPRFLTPGTVRAMGRDQVSGKDGNDFSGPVEYRVQSRVGYYVRTYTVTVTFIEAVRGIPRMLTFGLSRVHNPGIIKDGTAMIADGNIVADLHYGGTVAPQVLVPHFTAQGIVTVLGSVQVSGTSPQDFGRKITYRVTNPLDTSLKMDYLVQTRLIRDESSDALITSFKFMPERNAGLAEPVLATIQQDGIWAFMPEGYGVAVRDLVPEFEATGEVRAGGIPQISGSSRLSFAGPVEYTVTSVNGLYSKTYTVNVRETPNPRIYVDAKAAGWNDGTGWRDAFRDLREAAQFAQDGFLPEVPKEIWIAAGTYRPEASVPIPANTKFMGGFSGLETEAWQRNFDDNKTVISGNGQNDKGIFSDGYGERSMGSIVFEHIEFTNTARAIYYVAKNGHSILISDCIFSDLDQAFVVFSKFIRITGSRFLRVRDHAIALDAYSFIGIESEEIEISGNIWEDVGEGIGIYGQPKSVIINNSRMAGVGTAVSNFKKTKDYLPYLKIEDMEITGNSEIAVKLTPTGRAEISDVKSDGRIYVDGGSSATFTDVVIDGSPDGGIYVSNVTGPVVIDGNTVVKNTSGDGISLTGGSGIRYLDGVTVSDIDQGRAIVVDATATSDVTLTGVTVRDITLPAVHLGNMNGSIFADPPDGRPAVFIKGRNVTVSGVTVDRVPYSGTGTAWWADGEAPLGHGGMHIDAPTVTVSGTKVNDTTGDGIRIAGTTITVDGKSSFANNDIALLLLTGGTANITVNDVTIRGGSRGICANNNYSTSPGKATISKVDIIMDANKTYTYGIYLTGNYAISIYETTVETWDGINTGYGYTNNLKVGKTTIKNASQALNTSNRNFEITGVDFINCRSEYGKTIIAEGSGTFLDCSFIHDDLVERYEGEPSPGGDGRKDYSMFGTVNGSVKFERCRFENIVGASARDTYLFSRWGSGSTGWTGIDIGAEPLRIELKDCQFIFKQGERVGLFAGFAGYHVINGGQVKTDTLNVSNTSITNKGSKTPLFNFVGGNSFSFKPNNRYRTSDTAVFVTLNTVQAIIGLGTGVVKLEQGGMPTLVP